MTEVDRMVRNRHLVEGLERSLRDGKHGLSVVPGLLKRVLIEESWREFVTQRDEHVFYERFTDFVVMPPLKGIGATVELLQRLVEGDPEAEDLLDKQLKEDGRQGKRTDLLNNMKEVTAAYPRGTSKDYALRKLRKDAPELHAEVIAGRLTAHAAMVKGGFRPRTFTVRADSPESVAAALRRQLDPNMLAKLAHLLAAADGS